MQIPVNKNIDEYKDDFYKGLTLRQTLLAILTVAVGTIAFLFFNIVLNIAQSISLYLALPFAFPIAASGFLKIGGMPPLQYIRNRKRVIQAPLFLYRPGILQEERADGNVTKKRRKRKKGAVKIILETEMEMIKRMEETAYEEKHE